MAAMIDILKFRNNLTDVGFTEAQANAQAEGLANLMGDNFATKDDLLATKTELKSEMGLLKKDLELVKKDLKTEIESVKKDLTIRMGIMLFFYSGLLITILKLII